MDKEKREIKRQDSKPSEDNKQMAEKKNTTTEEASSEESQAKKDIKNNLKQGLKKRKSPLKFHKNGVPPLSLKEKIKNKKDSLALLNKELSSVKEELKQALNNNLYLRAEFENFKRRSAEEISQLIRYGGERFISSLANEVLDDLDRAMLSAQEKESFENLQKGLEMIQKKLSQVLHSFGVEIFDPFGKVFDPSYQEALSHTKTSKVPEGHVAETVKKAYKLHGKVIRPAQVVLAKKEEDS